jgi:hypothetical protein
MYPRSQIRYLGNLQCHLTPRPRLIGGLGKGGTAAAQCFYFVPEFQEPKVRPGDVKIYMLMETWSLLCYITQNVPDFNINISDATPLTKDPPVLWSH